ncbi:hypothetical protein BC936DRAFT_144181 [Jimgerdemannia flammicorona]|uniref:NB-ARC domain-containing protein n=1 Tax=Jimgerdemannia flammicorona TaxID=994334 RepID=A0A432ZYG9_9FUNG|nr:hypothetical protein BC936DRAFT_144181 [Jimgerdemannia flammicorona]
MLDVHVDQTHNIDVVARAVITWLESSQSRWLLVFDDAYTSVLKQKYLPSRGCGNIIITTHNAILGFQNTVINIDEMKLSTDDLLSLLPSGDVDSPDIINMFDNHVLLIDVAGVYMRTVQLSAKNYIGEYDPETMFNNETIISAIGTDYPRTIYTALSIDKLQDSSRKLLHYISLLYPGDISIGMLNMLVCKTDKINLLILDLITLSLVRVGRGTISIDRSIQIIVRSGLQNDQVCELCNNLISVLPSGNECHIAHINMIIFSHKNKPPDPEHRRRSSKRKLE